VLAVGEGAALIGVGGTILAVLVGIWWETHKTHTRTKRVENAVNHVDEEVSTDGGAPTLGQMVKKIERVVERGFANNESQHIQMGERLNGHAQAIGRLGDAVERIDVRVEAIEKKGQR
jgi:phage shock protein A